MHINLINLMTHAHPSTTRLSPPPVRLSRCHFTAAKHPSDNETAVAVVKQNLWLLIRLVLNLNASPD